MIRRFQRLMIVAALSFGLVAAAFADPTTTPRKIVRPKVDLRRDFEKYRIPVRQQGKRGACQVFAMVGVMEYQLAKRGKRVDLSEQYIMWAANEANNLNRTEGFNPDWLIPGLKKYGICKESLMPYIPLNEAINKPSAKALKDAAARTSCEVDSIKHWSSKRGFDEEVIKKITDSLDKKVPVTATFCWPEGLYDEQIIDAQYFLIDKGIDPKAKSGHGVILVGYGLDKKMPGGGYFILRNSWGTKFADRGYAGITFELTKKYGISAYIVTIK